MRRRLLLGALAAGSMLATLGVRATPAKAPPARVARPNVLLILVDDLKPAIHGYGDPVAVTPNIDRLIRRGVRFDLAYANQAVCAPSRMNLMTGARSTSTGIYDFGVPMRRVLPDAVTLPQFFKAAGYRAEAGGKVFHIGHGNDDDAASWSAPHHRDKVVEYRDPASTGGRPTQEEALFYEVPVHGPDPFAYARTLPRGPAWESPDVPDEAYADGRTAAWATGRMQALQRDGKPFFLAVGFARPHLPFSVPRRYWDMYDPARLPMPAYEQLPAGAPAYADKQGGEIAAYAQVPQGVRGDRFPASLKRQLVHGYYAGVSYTDAQVGKLLDTLDRTGLSRNTIVVLWGDHGFHLGDHGIWTKHTNYEQATRIPLVIAGPGVRAGGVSRQLAETVDLYPTLSALAGLPRPRGPQPIDGVDLAPALGGGMAGRRWAYSCFPRGTRMGQAIRTDRYRLIRWTDSATGARETELYDLVTDPGETRNVAADRPTVRAGIDRILDRLPAPRPVIKR